MNYTTHYKKTLWLALPVVATQLGQITVNIADNIMVGKLGKVSLGAVSLGNSIFFMMAVLGFGVSSVITPIIAQKHSANKRVEINSYIKNSLIINSALALILVIIGLGILPFMENFKQPPEVITIAENYFMISTISFIPMMIFQTFRHFSEGMSLTIPITIATFIANIINITINYLLIYGNFNFPKMGVDGAAIGTLISRIILLILIIFILLKIKKTKFHIRRFWYAGISKPILKKLLNLGLPTGFQMFFEVSAFGLAAFICGMAGTIDLAAHQIAINLASISFLLCSGFGAAAAIRVGNFNGKKDFANLQKAGFSAIYITVLFMIICGIIFIAFKNQLPYIYINDSAVIHLASSLLVIAAFFQLSDGIQVVTLGALRGVQDVKIPTYITFIAYWLIAIPMGYYLAITLKMGAKGVWIGLGVGLTISAVLLIIRFIKLTTKLKLK